MAFPVPAPFSPAVLDWPEIRSPASMKKCPSCAGARLSGKLTDDLRIWLLNMQTQRRDWDTSSVLPAANFSVATLQQKVFSRSIMSGFLVNKQEFYRQFILRRSRKTGNVLESGGRPGIQPLFGRQSMGRGGLLSQVLPADPAQRGATAATFFGLPGPGIQRQFLLLSGRFKLHSRGRICAPKGRTGDLSRHWIQFVSENGWAADHMTNFSFGSSGSLTFGLSGKNTDRDVSLICQNELCKICRKQTWPWLTATFTFLSLLIQAIPENPRFPLEATTTMVRWRNTPPGHPTTSREA